MYGIINSSGLMYDGNPYELNGIYLTLYGLLWPRTTSMAFYGHVQINIISYSILRY